MASPTRSTLAFQSYQDQLKLERKMEMQKQMEKDSIKAKSRLAQYQEKLEKLPQLNSDVLGGSKIGGKQPMDHDIFGSQRNHNVPPSGTKPEVVTIETEKDTGQVKYQGLGLNMQQSGPQFMQSPYAGQFPNLYNPYTYPQPYPQPYAQPLLPPQTYLPMSPMQYQPLFPVMSPVPQQYIDPRFAQSPTLSPINPSPFPTSTIGNGYTQQISTSTSSSFPAVTQPNNVSSRKSEYAAELEKQIREKERANQHRVKGNLYRDVHFDLQQDASSPFDLAPPERKTARRFVLEMINLVSKQVRQQPIFHAK